MSDQAQVTNLSPSTKLIVAYHGSGRVLSAIFIRGRQAFVLEGREADKTLAALSEALKAGE